MRSAKIVCRVHSINTTAPWAVILKDDGTDDGTVSMGLVQESDLDGDTIRRQDIVCLEDGT